MVKGLCTCSLGASLFVLATILPAEGHEELYSFRCIARNKAMDAAIGEAQLSVDIIDWVEDQMLCDFRNIGSAPCAITPVYVATTGFSAGSDSTVWPNAVNPRESMGTLFNLINGRSLAEVIDDLGSQSLRTGIHVQGSAGSGAESFVNDDQVSVLAAAVLGVLGLGVAGWRLRKYA